MSKELLSPDELKDTELSNSYKLILHNDNHNSFEWVILCLISVLNISVVNAEQLATLAHHKGKIQIKHGSHDDMLLFKDALDIRGIETTIEN